MGCRKWQISGMCMISKLKKAIWPAPRWGNLLVDTKAKPGRTQGQLLKWCQDLLTVGRSPFLKCCPLERTTFQKGTSLTWVPPKILHTKRFIKGMKRWGYHVTSNQPEGKWWWSWWKSLRQRGPCSSPWLESRKHRQWRHLRNWEA